MVEAFTASEARSWVQTGSIGTTVDGPYRQAYTLDAGDNMTQKWGRSYTGTFSRTQTVDNAYSATTGRNSAWTYDADGRMIADDAVTSFYYDEAGGLPEESNNTNGTFFTQDGDGQKAKMVFEGNATHYLHSSVLGQTIAEMEIDGSRRIGFVYADGQLIATQVVGAVFWQHTDASGRSRRTTITGGVAQAKDEVDPMDVKLDRPGLNNHNTASGVGGKSAGGAEARVASLMDLGMCDFAGMLVPCGIEGSLREQLGDALPQHQQFWNYGRWSGASYGTRYLYLFGFEKGRSRLASLLKNAKTKDITVLRLALEELSVGLGQGNDERDDGPQVVGFDRILEDLADIIKDGTCRSFIADLVGTAQEMTRKTAHAFSVEGMLAALKANPREGTINGMDFINDGLGGGYGGWNREGKGVVRLGSTEFVGTLRSAERSLALVLLHELIHTSTKISTSNQFTSIGYSDVELAQAVFKMFGDPDDDITNPKYKDSKLSDVSLGGIIWDRALRRFCK